MADKRKEVVKRGKNEIVAAKDYSEFEGRGFQNQTQDDIAIPFINLLQSNSPEVDKKDERFIEGAEAGMFINTLTKELFAEVYLTPSVTRHLFVEWIKRNDGGGLVGFHACNSEVVKAAKAASTEFGKFEHDGHDLVETFEIWGAQSIDGGPGGAVVAPFTSKKIKSYKHIMGRLNSYQKEREGGGRYTPPLFAHLIKIIAVGDKNEKGSFYKTAIEAAVENDVDLSTLDNDDPRFLLGAEIEQLVMSGKARADYESQASSGDGDEDLPF